MDLKSLPTKERAPAWAVWVALWIVYIVWGSTYLAIRVTVETMPPLLTAGTRFLVAGSLLYGWLALRRGRGGVRITVPELGASALVGGALLLGGNGLVSIAERDVSSSLAALIIGSVPLWVVVWRRITGDRVSRGTLAGVAVGFLGVAILVLPSGRPGAATLAGLLLLIVAAFSWATGSFFAKKLPLPSDLLVSTAAQMISGGAILTVAGLLSGEGADVNVSEFSGASLLALGYLIVIGSWVAFTAYVWLLQNAPISKVATYAYVNPVIAIFLGWIILSEEITAAMLVGATVIIASVAAIVRKEGEKHAEVVEPTPGFVPAECSGTQDGDGAGRAVGDVDESASDLDVERVRGYSERSVVGGAEVLHHRPHSEAGPHIERDHPGV
ncbi:MAG: EamA family transporter [Actinomycetota bacterium]